METFKEKTPLPLIEALSQHFPESSKTTLRKWLLEGRINLDGKVARSPGMLIHKGQKISLNKKKKTLARMEILYQDRHLIAIEKPAGLLSVATAFTEKQTAHALLKTYLPNKRVFPVHRLDQDTSGVMLFALSDEGRVGLKEAFFHHAISRTYIGIVSGSPPDKEGSWDSFLVEDSSYHVKETSNPSQGKRAITHYQVVAEKQGFCRLLLRLETGRKNQIRVHCSAAGVPIVGDSKYGSKVDPIHRLGLHAHTLELAHPVFRDKTLSFTSPIPKAFCQVC